MRLNFIIQGNNVQNVGYRLFLFQLMKELGLRGYPINISGGKHIHVIVWGAKNKLLSFYNSVKLTKPKSVKKTELTEAIFDKTPQPEPNEFFNEKMDLMIEQTGKFVEIGKSMDKSLKGLNRNVSKLPNEIGKQLKST